MKKKIMLWLMQSKFYAWLLYRVIPFVRFSMYYTDLRGFDYHDAYEPLKMGDVLLGVDRRKLTTMLIPGLMSHAALCVGKRADGYHTEIVEMTHHDFTQSMMFDICKEADRVVIMRCLDFDPEYIEAMIRLAWTFKDAKYDTNFELGIKSLYCSELVWQADFEKRMKVSLEDLAGLGRPYISPNGLLYGENMICVHDTAHEFTGMLGSEIKAKVYEDENATR